MILAPTLTLSAGSGAAIVRPTFSRDFAGEKTLNNGTGPAITFTRASNATFFNASGVLQTASNDQPRFDHDPATGASRGLLIEEARTNSIRNSQAGGSTNGVIGSGGVMPTNWIATGTASGITREILGAGTSNGFSYIDIKLSGTASANGVINLYPDGFSTTVASQGQAWTSSCYVAVVNGSFTNTSSALIIEETDGSSGLANSSVSFSSAISTLSRFSISRTFTNALTTRAGILLQVSYLSGAVVNLTLRIAAPQLEQGAFPTSYIPTTTAAATRSADSAVVTPISSFYNQSEGTLFAEASFNAPTAHANGQHVLDLNDNTTDQNRTRFLRLNATGVPTFRVTSASASVAVIDGSSALVGAIAHKLAAVYRVNDFAFYSNASLLGSDSIGSVPSGVTHVYIGRDVGSPFTGSLNGHIRKIAYWPKRLSNTLLQQLTT